MHEYQLLLVVSMTLMGTLPTTCLAEMTRGELAEGNLTVVRMTVEPSRAPEPSFKYRLLRPLHFRQRGNAVPFYHRALTEMQRIGHQLQETYGTEYQQWAFVAPEEFPLDDARQAVAAFEPVVANHLEIANQRSFADWGFEEEQLRGEETVMFLLPEIQEMRALGRMLALRARVAVREGRLDDAFHSVAIAMAMARDISSCKFMVCDLVAIATAGSMDIAIEELLAAHGAPNLYWALMALPDPLVFGHDSVELEMAIGYRMFPWLATIEETEYAADQWRSLFTQALAEVKGQWGSDPLFVAAMRDSQEISVREQAVLKHALATLYALKTYPAARRALIAGGMAEHDVNAMPVAKVLLLQTSQAYRHIAHEMEKAWHVPYRDAKRMEHAAINLMHEDLNTGTDFRSLEPIPIASFLLPASVAYRQAHEGLRRQLVALAVIEALRIHAGHAGRLPATLAEITAVPVPDNPVTGKPFEYRLEGDIAVLMLPIEDGFHRGKRYEIRLMQ